MRKLVEKIDEWLTIKRTIGIRISNEAEKLGTDKVEIGVVAYGIRD